MDIKAVMSKHVKVTIDKVFVNKINDYKMALISKNSENLNFMSSYYTGVHAIRFTDEDRENMFFFLGVEPTELKEDIKHIRGLDKNWKVVTDEFNLSMAWVLYLISQSKLSSKDKEEAITDVGIILQFRFLTSLYFRYFKYPVTEDLAQMVYEKLSKDFLIRIHGSNYKVLDFRARSVYKNRTLYKKLVKGNLDGIKYVISDMQLALRSMLKRQFSILVELKESESSRTTTSPIGSGEDSDRILEVDDAHSYYIRAIKEKVLIKSEFINYDLLEVIGDIFPKANTKAVVRTLNAIHERALSDPKKTLDLLEQVIDVSVHYLYVSKLYPPYADRVSSVLIYLKGLWSASGTSDKRMRTTKADIGEIVKEASNIKTKWVVSSVTIVVATYLLVLVVFDHKRK